MAVTRPTQSAQTVTIHQVDEKRWIVNPARTYLNSLQPIRFVVRGIKPTEEAASGFVLIWIPDRSLTDKRYHEIPIGGEKTFDTLPNLVGTNFSYIVYIEHAQTLGAGEGDPGTIPDIIIQ